MRRWLMTGRDLLVRELGLAATIAFQMTDPNEYEIALESMNDDAISLGQPCEECVPFLSNLRKVYAKAR